MNARTDSISCNDSEEEDLGCYFLQPSSSPYNMTEKVKRANMDLFNSNIGNNEKTVRVKFKAELISFEPDLTDDDVNSIESDETDDRDIEAHALHLEYTTELENTIEEVTCKVEEEIVIEDEEISEDIENDLVDTGITNIEHGNKLSMENEHPKKKDQSEEMYHEKVSSSTIICKRKKIRREFILTPSEVHCKDHCIDKLDFDLPMSIKKLELHENPTLPPLQLLQRKCCNKTKQHLQRNLPNYNGLRSEYGLTASQIEKKEKHKEVSKLKLQIRKKILNEYNKRKNQQNEEVFCQWLKEISRRKQEQTQNNKNVCMNSKQNSGSSVSSTPNKYGEKIKQRPKSTQESFNTPSNFKKIRRPHTTHSCVFIEVPQNFIEQGLVIKNFTIANSKLVGKQFKMSPIS